VRINRILKTTGFLSLLGISIYLSISLSAQLAQPKSRFPLVQMAETEGWCASSSITTMTMTYGIHISKEKPFVLFESLGIDDPLHTNESAGTKGGYWADYPEVTPYFFVVIENDGTNKKLFTGGDTGNKKIRARMKVLPVPEGPSGDIPHYDIVNLSENGLELSDAGIDKAEISALNRKGLYYVLGFDDENPGDSIDSFKLALGNTNTIKGEDAMGNELEIVFDKDNPFQVVAIKTWNYEDCFTDLPIDFESFVQDPATDLLIEPLGITLSSDDTQIVELNIDKVDLVREEIQRHIYLEDGSLEDFVPEAGEHIDDKVDSLGRFVVAGIIVDPMTGEGRTYDEIIEILVDIALGNTAGFITGDLPSGGGEDWLQVAAADIYNEDVDSEVFNCVWEIISGMHPSVPDALGAISPEIPDKVYLDPFDIRMRFNLPGGAYNFHCNKTRDSVVWHESLHSYAFLPGRLVNDEEDGNHKMNDRLFVKQGGGQAPYLTFSYDDKSRGFLRPNPIWEGFNISKVRAYLDGHHGDDYFFDSSFNSFLNDSDDGRFIMRIDDKLTEDDLKQLFVDGKDIVPDPFIHYGFPEGVPTPPDPGFEVEGIYLYLEPGIDCKIDFLTIGRSRQQIRVESDYGYYDTHDQEIIKIESWALPDSFPSPKICFKLLKRGYAKLYVLFRIKYFYYPGDYDASYFADITRGRWS